MLTLLWPTNRFSLSVPYLTVESSVTMGAGALVCAVAVVAGPSIHAGFGVTLIDVVLTVAPCEAGRAQTREGVDAVHTGATVKAGAAGEKNGILRIKSPNAKLFI